LTVDSFLVADNTKIKNLTLKKVIFGDLNYLLMEKKLIKNTFRLNINIF